MGEIMLTEKKDDSKEEMKTDSKHETSKSHSDKKDGLAHGNADKKHEGSNEHADKKQEHKHEKNTKSEGVKKYHSPHTIVRHKKKDPILRNSLIAIFIIIGLVVIIFAITNRSSPVPGSNVNEGAAVMIGDEVLITTAQLDSEYNNLPEFYHSIITKRSYLETVMVPQELLLIKAEGIPQSRVDAMYDSYLEATGIDEAEVLEMLSAQGLTIERFKDLVRVQIYLNDTLYDKTLVSDEEIGAFYEESKEMILDEEGQIIPFDEVREEIRNLLQTEKMQEETQLLVNEFREELGVVILYEDSDALLDSSNESSSTTMKEGTTFADTGDEICIEDGKPIIRLYSTTWCPHCTWIADTFDQTVKEYVDKGLIVAYHWEFDTKDNTLTPEVEGDIPLAEMDTFQRYNPDGSIPTFLFGCKYLRIGNGYERQNDLAAEKAEFVKLIEELIASS
jgi:thiol-disulfide isomerase/thioredoxin